MLKLIFVLNFLFLIIVSDVQSAKIGLPKFLNNNNKTENSNGSSFTSDAKLAITNVTEYFTKNGVTLNCFGIPMEFAKIIERLFTQSTEAEDVRFYFFSQDQPKNVTVRVGDNFTLTNVNFRNNRTTIFIVHGFMSSGTQDWVINMKDALLNMGDYNVIIVDWQKGSNTWNYVTAAISTKIVGTQIAKLLGQLSHKALEETPDLKTVGSLYLIGHSLGAHMVANVAYLVKNSQLSRWWNVERITGLDPAQPCFKSTDLALKLDKNDASFVDVIHTNADNLLLLGLGLPDQLGTLDFYPNGGRTQLGCDKIGTSFWSFLMLPKELITRAICSHGRSHQLFTDSINVEISKSCTYVGHKWNRTYENIDALLKENCEEDICPEMGINSINYQIDKNHTYFVPTGDSQHYCNITESHRNEIKKQLLNDGSVVNKVITAAADKIIK